MNLDKLLLIYKKAKSSMKKGGGLVAKGNNLSCGDEVKLYLKLKGKMVEEISFESKGCAISTVSAYLLCDHLKGKSIEEIKLLSVEDYLKLIEMEGVSSARFKCAAMPFVTLKHEVKSL